MRQWICQDSSRIWTWTSSDPFKSGLMKYLIISLLKKKYIYIICLAYNYCIISHNRAHCIEQCILHNIKTLSWSSWERRALATWVLYALTVTSYHSVLLRKLTTATVVLCCKTSLSLFLSFLFLSLVLYGSIPMASVMLVNAREHNVRVGVLQALFQNQCHHTL